MAVSKTDFENYMKNELRVNLGMMIRQMEIIEEGISDIEEEREKFEDETDRLKDRISELEDENQDLRNQIEDLEEALAREQLGLGA